MFLSLADQGFNHTEKLGLSRITLFSIQILFGLTASATALAGELAGYVSLESRFFPEESLSPDQSDTVASFAANLEYFHDWDNYKQRFVVSGFARADDQDSERSHADLRELYWRRDFNRFELSLGVRQVFWGVTETAHLVDVINQDDLVENIDGEDKLGQPMLSILIQQEWGTLEFFSLFGFRERTFPSAEGRPRTTVVVDPDLATYQSSGEHRRVDFALRWSRVVGNWDLGLSHFSGTSRDPLFSGISADDGSLTSFAPHYILIDQTGADLQMTEGAWLWKLEAISIQEKDADRNTAIVGGFEYSFYGIAGSNIDLGFFMEYQFDDRLDAKRVSPNQDDLALGTRWSLNDYQSTEILVAMTEDLELGSRFFSMEASRRVTDHWFFETELRLFSDVDEGDLLYDFRNDDYFEIDMQYYF